MPGPNLLCECGHSLEQHAVDECFGYADLSGSPCPCEEFEEQPQ